MIGHRYPPLGTLGTTKTTEFGTTARKSIHGSFRAGRVRIKGLRCALFDGTKEVTDLSRPTARRARFPVITGSPIPTSLTDDVDRRCQVVIGAMAVDQHKDASAAARRGFL